jgi:tripartite-type tricarboxylate transporter receptor subunit TctC
MPRHLTRRHLLAATATAALASPSYAADPWPTRQIRVLMPFGPGGAMDMLARLLAPDVSQQLGQSVVVDNRPGATGTLAMAAVASAPADGYTMMFTGSSQAIVGLLMHNLPFAMDAFTPLSLLTLGPTVMAVPRQLGVKTLVEFVAAAKAQGGKWSYGTTGIGTSLHLGIEMFKRAAGIDLVHIPYKSTPAILSDLLENRIQMSIFGVSDILPTVATGQLVGLALSHTERLPGLPDLPTFAELGYDKVKVSVDFGVAIHAGTPAPIQARLEEAWRMAVKRPEMRERLAASGMIVVGTTSAEFARKLADDNARFAEIIKVADIRLE